MGLGFSPGLDPGPDVQVSSSITVHTARTNALLPLQPLQPPQPLQYQLSPSTAHPIPTFLPPRGPASLALSVSSSPSPADLAAASWSINYNVLTLTLTPTLTLTTGPRLQPRHSGAPLSEPNGLRGSLWLPHVPGPSLRGGEGCIYYECPRALLCLVYCAGRAQSCFLTILRIPSALLTHLAPASCTLHPEFYTP